MNLTEFARKYVTERNLKGRTPIYSAARFERLIGKLDINWIKPEHLQEYRNKCLQRQLSAKTIESSIGNLLTLIHEATGRRPGSGRRLPIPRPAPVPPRSQAIDAAWNHMPDWLRQFVVISYWTCMRLSDVIRLQASLTDRAPDTVRARASKTGHVHVIPAPIWLHPWLVRRDLPYKGPTDYAKRLLRQHLYDACKQAGTDLWKPKHLRQAALTAWTRANAAAGAIIHGQGLRTLDHYIDPVAILESAAPCVQLPNCFGACTDEGENLMLSYRRLDPESKKIIANIAKKLAGAG